MKCGSGGGGGETRISSCICTVITTVVPSGGLPHDNSELVNCKLTFGKFSEVIVRPVLQLACL